MILYLPFVPSRALHVLDIRRDRKNVFSEQYRYVPLRMSWRLVLKAFLNRWGNTLGFIGAFMLCIDVYLMVTTKGPVVGNGQTILVTVFGMMFAVGVVCKIAWLMLARRDEKIKDFIGFHAQGSSDPLNWQSRHAEEMARTILQQESLPSLVAVAQRAVKAGNRSYAAFCLRLAMRNRNDFEAEDMLDRLLAE
jgi:hypothetical protein